MSGHPDGLPEFFLDRSLGRRQVPALLWASGLRLQTLSEVYVAAISEACRAPGPFLYAVSACGPHRLNLS